MTDDDRCTRTFAQTLEIEIEARVEHEQDHAHLRKPAEDAQRISGKHGRMTGGEPAKDRAAREETAEVSPTTAGWQTRHDTLLNARVTSVVSATCTSVSVAI